MIDLDEVSFIDSSGMRAIIVMERRAEEERIAFALAPPPAPVTELLQITASPTALPLAPRPDDAPPSEPFLERIEIALTRDPERRRGRGPSCARRSPGGCPTPTAPPRRC